MKVVLDFILKKLQHLYVKCMRTDDHFNSRRRKWEQSSQI